MGLMTEFFADENSQPRVFMFPDAPSKLVDFVQIFTNFQFLLKS